MQEDRQQKVEEFSRVRGITSVVSGLAGANGESWGGEGRGDLSGGGGSTRGGGGPAARGG